MGRPIHKKYFGNLSTPPIGGEGISSVTIGGTNNNYTVKPTFTVGTPNLPGGTQAVVTATSMGAATVTVTAGGTGYTNGDTLTVVGLGTGTAATLTVTNAIAGVIQAGGVTIASAGVYTTVTDVTDLAVTGGTGNNDATFTFTLKVNAMTVSTAGSGYTSAPTVQDAPDGNATFTAVLSSGTGGSAIEAVAYITGGSAKAADIVAQKASRRYLVENSDGTEICKLVAAAPAAGEMTLTAIDSAGGTYYVTKLTAHRALIVKGDRSGTQFTTGADGISVPWVFGTSATLNETVEIKSS